uniref:Uncharacterized protein n=1 Tax=Mustela putorius furo TaxID=9669 RepID=M3XPL5_MUSPF
LNYALECSQSPGTNLKSETIKQNGETSLKSYQQQPRLKINWSTGNSHWQFSGQLKDSRLALWMRVTAPARGKEGRERREKTRREEGAEKRGVWARERRYRKRRQTEQK